jgi:L-histidine N-alpha-methyltransferase
MWLRASQPMRVHLPALPLVVEFAAGEELLTEISAKFRREGLTAELTAAGFEVRRWWTDPAGQFSLSLAQATMG